MILLILSLNLILFRNTGTAEQEFQYLEGYQIARSDRIMVISPHPDDESLAVAGVIRRAVKDKVPIRVVLMTNGDGSIRTAQFYFKTFSPGPEQLRELGVVRHLESLSAMKKLGLKEENVIFLSYPDGGINSLFDENWDKNNLHLGLNGDTHVPYSFAYEKGAPYYGENIVKDLGRIIKSFKPNIIFYPDPGDNHHDHWATNAFVEYVLSKTNYQGRQFTYLVHMGFGWFFSWFYVPEKEMSPPPSLLQLDAKWFKFFLSKDEENLKRKALDLYVSQTGIMKSFLIAFVRKNELFAYYPDIKVARLESKPNFFSEKHLSHTVFRDPQNDTFISDFEGFGDMTAVGFAFYRRSSWLAIETQRGIAGEVAYVFRLRVFGKKDVRRLDIRVHNGIASSEVFAQNSVKINTPITVQIKKKRLVVRIPAYVFKNANRFLLSVDALNSRGRRIDRTAYRKIDF